MSKRAELNRQIQRVWSKLFNAREKPTNPVPPPSWDPWEIDPKFVKALSQWNEDHPESTLERVFGKINTALQTAQPLFEIIPDSPFPARGLVQALAGLLNLGYKVTRAKSEVQEFASQTVQWVTAMTTAFKEGRLEVGSFAWRTKRNLAERSALIREICVWAASRLNDNRWSQVANGLSISGEIDEFKARLADTRDHFLDLSMINLSQGIDQICQEVKRIQELQREQLSNIMKALENQNQAEERRQFMDRMLRAQVVADPTYSKQGKLPCDPDTRVDILAGIKAWIHDLSNDGKCFLWLTGDPGSGKSAITASIAKDCKDARILWAQFFINRNNEDTTEPTSFFPSIARQLADYSPSSQVAVTIHDALKEKGSIVDDISAEQALKLFVDAVEVAAKLDTSRPVVVVIDGLDETKRSRLHETAKIFSTLFKTLKSPNVKVLIASRTDDEIRKPFAMAYHVDYVKHIHLDTAEESSVRDVSTFITRKVARIVEDYDLNWIEWPGEERMQALCIRASGLFIWAATAEKFIREQLAEYGTEFLNELLDALSHEGMGDINVLYGTILGLTYRKSDDWGHETFRRIVGCIVVLREPLSIGAIRDMLDLRKTKTSGLVDVAHFVRRLRTVLVAGADAVDDNTVPRLHKSFFEYITSERAEARFRVSVEISNGELLTRCLLQLSDFHRSYSQVLTNEASTGSVEHVPAEVHYAVRFWTSHTSQEDGASSGIVVISGTSSFEEVREQLKMPLEGKVTDSPLGITCFPDRSRTLTSWDTNIHVWDGLSGQPVALPSLEGHTAPVHSVAFSPDGTRVISGSADNTIRLWDVESGQPVGSPLMGHTKPVASVAFSPDSTRFASGSYDSSIRLWDARSCQPVGTPLQGHTDWIYSVAFSPDGTRLASCSKDKYIRLWDVQSGKPVGLPLTGPAGFVYSAAFSPDGNRLASGSKDNYLRIWNIQSGRSVGSPVSGHNGHVYSVAFSLDGKYLISGSLDHTVRLWDAESVQAIGLPLEGHTEPVTSVAFSPDGMRIASGSDDHSIRLWEAQSGQPVGKPLRGHASTVFSIAFSSDGAQLVSSSDDKTIRIWDAQTGKPSQRTFRHTSQVHSIIIFPDGQRLISASFDAKFQVRNLGSPEAIATLAEGDMSGVASVAVSPDGSYIVAVDLIGIVCLWDAATCQLMSRIESNFGGLTSHSFSSNGNTFNMSRIDGTACRLKISNGKLSILSTTSNPTVFQHETASSFDKSRGWKRGSDESRREVSLRWLPLGNPDAGMWAYVDGKVIRTNGVDSVIIVEVGGDTNGESHSA